jgi:hypothetical protein
MDSHGTSNQEIPFRYTMSTEACDGSSSIANKAETGSFGMAFPMMPPTDGSPSISLFHNAMLAANGLDENELERKVLSRKNRLEQNRKAARESRRRKKLMVDELQRSVIFFTRANALLRQKNSDLLTRISEAQRIVTAHEFARLEETGNGRDNGSSTQQVSESPGKSPSMRIGATMKAMASFQEAASAAMQSAMKGLASISAHHIGKVTDEGATGLTTASREPCPIAFTNTNKPGHEQSGKFEDPKYTMDFESV